MLGAPIDCVGWPDILRLSVRAMRERTRLQLGDVNVAKVVQLQTDANLRRCLRESDVVCVDGVGVLWGCRILGIPVKDRIAGVDLMSALLRLCALKGFKPYLLGARESVVADLVDRLKAEQPGLDIAGWRNGYFKEEDEAEIVAEIKASGADCLFVGISSPIKETFLNKYRDQLDVPVQIGVGGSFDVLSGHLRRAPVVMQRTGLEWLFRLAQEPRRLATRYLVTNLTFLALLTRSILILALRK